MFVPLWLLALAALAFALLAVMAFRPRSDGEMIEGQQRAARRIAAHASPASAAPDPGEAAVLALPEIRTALDHGRKLEAIKLVRERTGLGLKEAKDLVERA